MSSVTTLPFRLRLVFLIPLAAILAISGCRTLPEKLAEKRAEKAAAAAPQEGEVLLPAQNEAAPILLKGLRQELERSQRELRRPDYPAPYFIAYRLADEGFYQLAARHGAVFEDKVDRRRTLYSEIRVGSYEFDNRGGQWSYQGYMPVWDGFEMSAPLENVPAALRRVLWLLSDAVYKSAIESYLRLRAENVQKAKKRTADSFARVHPEHGEDNLGPLVVDRAEWRRRLKRASAILTSVPDVIDGYAQFWAIRTDRFFVTSEGTDLASERIRYSLQLSAFARAEDGAPLDGTRVWSAPSVEELPNAEELAKEAQAVVDELLALRKAEPLPPYTGPAVLSPDATGVFFHEAVGHRLEGERQEDEHSGQTFRGKVGEEIIPTFLSVYDDPTQEREDKTSLSGTYAYDDEGVPSENVALVEDGKLKSFLLSRAPVEGFPKSNGHGRADAYQAPMARMGNLIVRSAKTADEEELLKQLRAETKKQGLPFGLYISDVDAGETNTSRYGVQAFRGIPRRVWKVDAATGEKTLVRGVEIIGTPLASIKKILVTGDTYEVFNGYCGAESGMVPVSTVAPAALLSEIETQRLTQPPMALPIAPPPAVPPPPKEEIVP